jgi:methylenetetrahydrofolate reductase (NADPH)
MRGSDTVLALSDSVDPRWGIVELMRRASTEITTHDEHVVCDLGRALPPGTTVYVAHTPKASLDDVVRVSQKVQSVGLRASPHIVARRIPDESVLRAVLRNLRSAGIEQVLLIAGDRETPVGRYKESSDVMDSGALSDAGILHLGVAGHPEGIKGVEPKQLWDALLRKQEFGQRTGISVHITTQFGFDPEGICTWVQSLATHGITLPVHVGVAGPTSLVKLMRFAATCGVGASLRMAAKNMKSVTRVARTALTPEEMISALVQCQAEGGLAQIVQPHFFSFGGALRTSEWIRAVSAGDFTITPDGKIVV